MTIFYPVLLVPGLEEREAGLFSVGLVILSQWCHISFTQPADITAIWGTYKGILRKCG